SRRRPRPRARPRPRRKPTFSHLIRRPRALSGSRLGAGAALPVPADTAFDCREERVVVAREPLVHVPLEPEAPHPRVERLVALGEVDAGAAVPEVREPLEALGPRPEWLADGVVAPRLVQLHLGEPLPRLAHAPRQQKARNGERAVADEPVPDVVAGMED